MLRVPSLTGTSYCLDERCVGAGDCGRVEVVVTVRALEGDVEDASARCVEDDLGEVEAHRVGAVGRHRYGVPGHPPAVLDVERISGRAVHGGPDGAESCRRRSTDRRRTSSRPGSRDRTRSRVDPHGKGAGGRRSGAVVVVGGGPTRVSHTSSTKLDSSARTAGKTTSRATLAAPAGTGPPHMACVHAVVTAVTWAPLVVVNGEPSALNHRRSQRAARLVFAARTRTLAS